MVDGSKEEDDPMAIVSYGLILGVYDEGEIGHEVREVSVGRVTNSEMFAICSSGNTVYVVSSI